MTRKQMTSWLNGWAVPLALTAVLIGYLTTWLPHPAAGLTLIGLDISEWVKFLPQMQNGELPNRDWFYLPPVTLGALIILWSVEWGNGRWQTWVVRLLGVGVSLLAFPSIEAIRFEAAGEWRPRIALIGCVFLLAVGSFLLGRWRRLMAVLIVFLGVIGLVLPTWAYMAVRPVVSALFGVPLGTGIGVWLNGVGHLAMVFWGGWLLFMKPVGEDKKTAA